MIKLRDITVTKRLQALVVDIIRRLWNQGFYRNIEWLRMIHDNWIGHWIDVKTAVTMRSVDAQAKSLAPEPEVVKPIYWEEEKGETPLGGPIGFTHKFDDAPSSADSVQGAE